MAYRRSYRRSSRRGYSRRTRTGGSQDYVRMARAAYKGVKYIKSMINAEKKAIDLPIALTAVNSTPIITLLTGVATGTDETNRDGRSILVKSVYMRGIVQRGAVDAIIRIILLIDKSPNGIMPVASDILLSATGPGWVVAPLNQDNAGSRFKIICDKTISLSSGTATTKELNVFRKLNHHAKYDGTSSAITDTTTGHLFALFVCNTTAAGDAISIQPTFRTMFYDN